MRNPTVPETLIAPMRILPLLALALIATACERKGPDDFGGSNTREQGIPRAAPTPPPVPAQAPAA